MRKTELGLSTENIQKLVLAFNNADRSNSQLLGGQVARKPLETFLYALSFIQDEHHRLPIEQENILNFEALVVYDLLERGVVDRTVRRRTRDTSEDNTQLPDAVNLLEQHLDNIQKRVGENEFIGKRLPTVGMELELPEADIEDRRGPLELLETLSDFHLFSFEIEQIFNGITHEENPMELRTSAFHSIKMLKSIFTIIDRMGAFDNYSVVPHITYASEYLDLFPGKSEAVIFTLMLFAGGLIPLPRKLLRQFATDNRLYREEYSKASFLGQEFEDGETVRIPFKTRRTFGSELKNVYGDHMRIGGFEAREMPEYPYPWINFVMRNSELVLPFVYAINALYKPVSLQTTADKVAALE